MSIDLEKLKFPIGEFVNPDVIEFKDIEQFIGVIEDFPNKLKSNLELLSVEELNWIYRPNGWNIKQVVHHCADSHINSFVRFKLALTEENPTIKPYDEAKWALQIDGNDNDVLGSLKIIDGLHYKWSLLLKSLSMADWKRTFYHPENKKTSQLDEIIAFYTWHSKHHLAHIEQALFYKKNF
ncbi:YfiT family bacillithiol transferase [Flavobacterium sp.]|uniref:YfiT family bacillithiol transferase n=1 Tax=Flavobacterium sp. TaxID=239 RepID=UPI0037518F56